MVESTLYKTALTKAMALCAGREMCKTEINLKLTQWGIGNDDALEIVNQLLKDKFIDEERYSIAFVRDKFRNNKWGKVKIASALKMKRIGDEMIGKALDAIDDAEYFELMKNIIIRHRKTVKAKNQFDLKGKLLRYGLSKGFESHLLYDLLNNPENSCLKNG